MGHSVSFKIDSSVGRERERDSDKNLEGIQNERKDNVRLLSSKLIYLHTLPSN
jgi:hypothetical protein